MSSCPFFDFFIRNTCSHIKRWKAALNLLMVLSLSINTGCCKAYLANYLLESTIYLIDFEIGCYHMECRIVKVEIPVVLDFCHIPLLRFGMFINDYSRCYIREVICKRYPAKLDMSSRNSARLAPFLSFRSSCQCGPLDHILSKFPIGC